MNEAPSSALPPAAPTSPVTHDPFLEKVVIVVVAGGMHRNILWGYGIQYAINATCTAYATYATYAAYAADSIRTVVGCVCAG